MLPAARVSFMSAAVKALHRAHNQRIRRIKDGHLPQERGKEREISNESAWGPLIREANV